MSKKKHSSAALERARPCTAEAFARACLLLFQHSPSSLAEAEFDGEVLHFRRGERLGQGIGNHLIGRAVYESDGSLLGDVLFERDTGDRA